MSNRPYKNIKRLVDTLSRQVKKTMADAKKDDKPKDDKPAVAL